MAPGAVYERRNNGNPVHGGSDTVKLTLPVAAGAAEVSRNSDFHSDGLTIRIIQ